MDESRVTLLRWLRLPDNTTTFRSTRSTSPQSGYQGESIEPEQAAERLYEYIEKLQPNTAEGFAVPPDKILPW